MLGELRLKLVIRHGCEGGNILKVTLLHPQMHCVILVKHLAEAVQFVPQMLSGGCCSNHGVFVRLIFMEGINICWLVLEIFIVIISSLKRH